MPHQVWRGIGGQGGVEPATGVPDQDIAGRQRGKHGIAPIRQGGLLIDERSVTGKVHRDAVVTELSQFVDHPVPASCRVKAAVHEDESHPQSTIAMA